MIQFFGALLVLQSGAATPADSLSLFDDANYGWLAMQTIFYLAIICGIIWLGLRYVLPRFLGLRPGGRGGLSVVDQLGIGPGRSVCIVKAAGRYYLVGVGEKGVSLMTELDEAEVERHYPPSGKEKRS